MRVLPILVLSLVALIPFATAWGADKDSLISRRLSPEEATQHFRDSCIRAKEIALGKIREKDGNVYALITEVLKTPRKGRKTGEVVQLPMIRGPNRQVDVIIVFAEDLASVSGCCQIENGRLVGFDLSLEQIRADILKQKAANLEGCVRPERSGVVRSGVADR